MLRTLPARRDSPPECVFRLFCPGRSCTFYRGDCVICPSCERQQPQGRRQQTPPAHPGESAAWANLLYRRTAPQAFQSNFSLKCFAFQTIRPVVSRKKRSFSAHFWPGGAVPPPRVSPFSKLKRSSIPFTPAQSAPRQTGSAAACQRRRQRIQKWPETISLPSRKAQGFLPR